MLNYAAQNYWRPRDANRRRDLSILDAVPQRGWFRPGDVRDEDEGVTKSSNTEHAIQLYATAPDLEEMSHWVNKIVQFGRADNAAAGLSVLAHKPLPSGFAGDVAGELSKLPEGQRPTVLSSILSRSDPGAKLHVARQLGELSRGADAGHPHVHGGLVDPFGARSHSLAASDTVRPRTAGQENAHSVVPSPADLSGKSPAANTSWPPLPRPHPDSEQRDAQRKAECERIRQGHARDRQAAADYEGRKKAAQSKLDALTRQQDNLRQNRNVVASDLAEARSRSTEPRQTIVRCPRRDVKDIMKRRPPPRRTRGNGQGRRVRGHSG